MYSRYACVYEGTPNNQATAKQSSTGGIVSILAFCLCLLASDISIADKQDLPLTLHYFGTTGLTRSSSGQAEFVRDLSQPDGVKGDQWSATVDSLAGLQLNLKINDPLEIVGQGVSRHHFGSTYTHELTWAYMKYSPLSELELHGGRLGIDCYMHADSRLVGYSCLTVRPFVDYFGDLPFQYVGGLDGTVKLPIGKGILRAKLFGGYSPEKLTFTWDASGTLVLDGNLDYQWDSWQLRFGYAQVRHARDLATITLGLRWDFYRGMDAKIQWDAVRGSPDSVFLVRGEQSGWDGQTHILSSTFDFAF